MLNRLSKVHASIAWHGMAWHALHVRGMGCGTARHGRGMGVAWLHDEGWSGMAWHGMAWHGMAWQSVASGGAA